jgi:predicted transcriptional regulator
MARRTFDVPNVTEILVHWDAGRSQSEIAASLGLDRKTVKKYLTRRSRLGWGLAARAGSIRQP